MVRNMVFVALAIFLSFAAGSYAEDAVTSPSADSTVTAAASGATPVVAPEAVTPVVVSVATPTEVTPALAVDVTTTDGESTSAWTTIKDGLWLILAGLAALAAIWWKKRKSAVKS